MSTEKENDPLLTSTSPMQHEYVGSAHSYKHFPRGHRIRKSVASSKRTGGSIGNSDSSLVLMNQRLPLYAERTMHLYLPRLTFDYSTNPAESLLKTKRTKCSFITNNKLCLRRKGINLCDLYSLRNNKTICTDDNTRHREKSSRPATIFSEATSPVRRNTANHSMPVPWDITSILPPDGTRQSLTASPMYTRLMRGLEREVNIPGHVRAQDCTGNKLGKVLTKEHLENLLKQEKPVIPAAFYMKF